MKKILITVMAVALCLSLMGGAFALFSDTEESTGNVMTAGTLDLETNFSSPVITGVDNMKPGDYVDVEITYTNVGSLDGDASFTLAYIEKDGTEIGGGEFLVNMTDDDVAKELLITGAEKSTDGGSTYTSCQADWIAYGDTWKGNEDGNLSVWEFKNAGTWDDTVTMSENDSHGIKFTITLADVGNDYQCDGIEATITITLNQ